MHRLSVILVLTTLLAACAAGDSAQRGPSPELQRQYNEAFQEMLAQPGDLTVALKYAAVATKAGDLEGAVSTYEGVLMVDSDLPQVRLQLGLLYYRLKSYEMARTYLESALQSPSLPADVRKPAEQLLAKMPKQSGKRRA